MPAHAAPLHATLDGSSCDALPKDQSDLAARVVAADRRDRGVSGFAGAVHGTRAGPELENLSPRRCRVRDRNARRAHHLAGRRERPRRTRTGSGPSKLTSNTGTWCSVFAAIEYRTTPPSMDAWYRTVSYHAERAGRNVTRETPLLIYGVPATEFVTKSLHVDEHRASGRPGEQDDEDRRPWRWIH